LHAAGAGKAVAIAVCVEDRRATDRIVELVKAEFPLVKLLVRSFDREHALKLAAMDVDYQIRETFESAMSFGEAALRELGVPEDEAAEISQEIRRRDAERYALELAGGGLGAGNDLLLGNIPKPTPFTKPKRKSASPAQAGAAMVADKDG
jgi:glutathione-regulated potassium-efflux system protein KefB